jgi:hypothetical protein
MPASITSKAAVREAAPIGLQAGPLSGSVVVDDRNSSVQHSWTNYGRGVTRNPGEAGPVFFFFL